MKGFSRPPSLPTGNEQHPERNLSLTVERVPIETGQPLIYWNLVQSTKLPAGANLERKAQKAKTQAIFGQKLKNHPESTGSSKTERLTPGRWMTKNLVCTV